MIYMLILEALARQAMGQMDQAMNLLERALALASTHGFVMSFVSHGSPMEALLREAVREGFPARIRPDCWRLSAQASPRNPLPIGFQPHSPLTSCSAGTIKQARAGSAPPFGQQSQRPQIADELFISLGTFQVHTKSIYGKLGVHNRIEAIGTGPGFELI